MAKRILLVEDHKDALSILVLVLRSLGYETIEARTGADGVEKAFFENPDLIVMDMSLPDMTGIDAARAIKKNPSTVRLPIIAYSAWSTRTWIEQAASAGIAAYLIKPVPMTLMKETIEKFILS
jgi:two-component system, cell cycle response regulator DivK